MFGKTRTLIIVAVTLSLFCAALVFGGLYFFGGALEGAFGKPTPIGIASWPPIKQTVWARGFPTTDPNAPVTPPNLGPVPLPPQTRGPDIPANMPQRSAGAGTIVENGGGARLNHGYSVVNAWYATTANEKIRVFAGGIWNDPLFTDRSQGFVSVEYYPHDSSQQTRPQIVVKTPSPTGALKIVDATDMKLNLQSERGTIYYFDVKSAKFVP